MIKGFENELTMEGKSKSTVTGYSRNIRQYYEWYKETYNKDCTKLYRVNILDHLSHLKGKGLSPKTINHKVASLLRFNAYLIDTGHQSDMVVSKKDKVSIQQEIATPTDVTVEQVERFRQDVLEQEGIRNYTIVTLLAYAGLRISECLNLNVSDIDIGEGTIKVNDSKGNKYRVVYMSDKVQNALEEHTGALEEKQEYLFVSNRGNRLDRTVINRMFNKHSKDITPHTLRHFFCTRALDSGLGIHEVANQAGHSNINTTIQYTNTSRQEMKDKMARL